MLIFLCLVFVLSGAAGLVYESIWTRYLGLFVGHGAYAQVLVLVIFLGGMSIGALAIGRRAERVRDPLRWYALVELAVGLIGLVFHDVFVWTTHAAYDTLFPALGPGALHSVAKWAIAALLILPQSVLLGATFPLMTQGALRLRPERGGAGRTIALLYFANSLGAAGGVLLAGFVLIAAAGLPGTLLAAAMANIVVAGAVFLAARRSSHEPSSEAQIVFPLLEKPDRDAGVVPRLHRVLLAVSFGTAVSSFVYEIGWIRMLSLVLGSATHSFELMLSAFILGLAIGALLIRRRAGGEGSQSALGRLARVQLAMGAMAVATLPVYARSFQWMEGFMAAFSRAPEGYVAFSLARYVICLAVMLPATICAGMTLPLITNLLMRGKTGERALGQVYGVNTLGSIVGVALAALVFLPVLGVKWMIVGGAAIDVGLGIWLLAIDGKGTAARRELRSWWPALAAVLLVVVVGSATQFNRGVLTSGVFRSGSAKAPTSPDLIYYADGRTATVSVRRIPRSRALFLATNGKTDASLGAEWFVPPAVPAPFTHDASTQLLLPLVTLAHVPHARLAAVIGQGSGMSSHTLLGDAALERVVTIEIEPEMLRASRSFYPANRRVFDDPRSVFALDDARSYFASQGERFDLILSEPSNPWVAGVSGLFTSEFYAHVRRYLTPGGVFGQWLHLSELNDGLALSVVRAVAENFPDYALYAVSNRDILIVATNQATLPAPDWSVFARPGVASDLRRVVPLTPAMLNALRMVDAATLAPLVRDGGGANSDYYPTLDLGAERARYLDDDAVGFVWMAGERFGLSSLTATTRAGVDGAPYTAIVGVPRLEAMELAARMRRGDFAGAAGAQLGASERARAVDRLLASDAAPVDWHVWVAALREADETRSGGSAGVADTALYAAAAAALVRSRAPVEARAAVAFMHGLASWDFAEASRAAGPLLTAARQGDYWLPPDLLRDGTVLARLRTHDVRGARAALDALASASSRTRNDLRAQLLTAWVRDAESPRKATSVTIR
jgi:predicted membrane-bound spermidine synthase